MKIMASLSKPVINKKRAITFALLVVTLLIMTTPALASSSANWYFVLGPTYTRWDGKANNQLKSLASGKLKLSGTIRVLGIDKNAPSPAPITVEVRRQVRFWFDPFICSATITPVDERVLSISANCPNIDSGAYYLIISKKYDDRRSIIGSGILTTP